MQNAALRVAVEHELFDHLLDNGKPGTEPITARRLMDRHGDPTLSEAMISKSYLSIALRGLTSPLSPYYESNRRYGLMQPGRQRLFSKRKDHSISFARTDEWDQVRVCFSYLPGLIENPTETDNPQIRHSPSHSGQPSLISANYWIQQPRRLLHRVRQQRK